MNAPLTAWVISDGRRGIENQALGLAEKMASQDMGKRELSISIKTISNTAPFRWLPAWTQLNLRKNPAKYFSDQNYPDIAIGCGRQAIAPLLALKRNLKDKVFTIYIQHPRLDPSYFDYVVAPEHDGLAGPNVISIIGSPNRITQEKLSTNQDLIPSMKGKVAAWLIGGDSKSHKLIPAIHRQHLDLLQDLLDSGWHILATTSRRTPRTIIDDYEALSSKTKKLYLYTGDGENPYFAYLNRANMIFVTEESTNMLTEACATGKPVFRLPMKGYAGKFKTLYDTLEARCRVVSAIDSDLSHQAYEPLDETDLAARKLWTGFDKRSVPLA